MADKPNYFDPITLSKLSTLLLRARYVVEGLISGLHTSPYKGFSVEFSEHRQYAPGDEIRHIDWKAYAKFDRYYIKEYEEETNLRCYLLVDVSASMNYRSNGVSKFDYACYLAAALAYIILNQQDLVGLVTFADVIITMTRSHRDAIVSCYPQAASRTFVLSRGRTDVADPIGGPQELYRRCAEQIDAYLADWVNDLDLEQGA